MEINQLFDALTIAFDREDINTFNKLLDDLADLALLDPQALDACADPEILAFAFMMMAVLNPAHRLITKQHIARWSCLLTHRVTMQHGFLKYRRVRVFMGGIYWLYMDGLIHFVADCFYPEKASALNIFSGQDNTEVRKLSQDIIEHMAIGALFDTGKETPEVILAPFPQNVAMQILTMVQQKQRNVPIKELISHGRRCEDQLISHFASQEVVWTSLGYMRVINRHETLDNRCS